MTAMTVAERMNAEEFLALGERPDARWLQLVEGEVVVTDPNPLHNDVQLGLVFALESWCRTAAGRGKVMLPLDIGVDHRNVFKPDMLWYAEDHKLGHEARRPFAVPDLAVEVRSPSTWRYDIGAKKSAYERNGLPELWLVDTRADAVLVFRRSRPDAPTFDVALELDRGQQLTSPLLQGFALELAEVFPEEDHVPADERSRS